jgi:hypothetical protein
MKNSGTILVAVLLLASTTGNAQTIHLTCDFLFPWDHYTCQLGGVLVLDNPNANFVFGGTHVAGFTNNDVVRVWITNSNIPFIISQLFVTFPNINWVTINNGGLKRIQSNAFANARFLEQLRIQNNPNFATIQSNAFVGLSQLRELELGANIINSVQASTFSGMTSLQRLTLRQTRISHFPANVFSLLPSLTNVFFHENLLTSLDGQLFSNNRQLISMTFTSNRINAIGRGFLDGLNNIRYVEMFNNICINNIWFINSSSEIPTIVEGLEPCFRNAGTK